MPSANAASDELEHLNVSPLAVLTLEVRYLRRDIGNLETAISTRLADHELRLRLLERRIYWASGFGGAMGAILGLAAHFAMKAFAI